MMMKRSVHSTNMGLKLYDHQEKAVQRMKNGCILCGGVGSGKSRTALAYYFKLNGGDWHNDKYTPMVKTPLDLYIITTARKRDTLDWESEMVPFLMSREPKDNLYSHKIVVDSWNNISKYVGVKGAFFIFDEQRAVTYGKWSKSLIKIAKSNKWILLSATPGDKWLDYAPVFIANGFYKNMTDFKTQHVLYSNYAGYPEIRGYIAQEKLTRLRNLILIPMKLKRKTVQHHKNIITEYDLSKYRSIQRDRWNPSKNKPIENASELCYELRKVVNTDYTRLERVLDIVEQRKRVIIFYNFDYELEMLRNLKYVTLEGEEVPIAEWNGHKHEKIPHTGAWVYLVQYTSGCEGWNCTETDTIIFFSQNYSYKVMEQASGRIDRLNTPYEDLYYYHLKSQSKIDCAIAKALSEKRNFNENAFVGRS